MTSSTEQGLFISNVVMDISKFLDVEATVRLSWTCHALHGLLIHDHDGLHPKIKATKFGLGDPCMLRDADGNRPFSITSTTGEHVSSVSLLVLLKLHFPSLMRLEFRFSPPLTFADGEDDLKVAFMHLAAGLESATELEELHIDVGPLLKFENSIAAIYHDLAKSLEKCTKLRRLIIFNDLELEDRVGQSYYSTEFLRALIPAVERGNETLEEVTLLIGNSPVVFRINNAGNPQRDLFRAVLGLRRLRIFNLQLNLVSGPLLNDFLEACNEWYRSSRTVPSAIIEKFSLICKLYGDPRGIPNPLLAPLGLSSLLALLRDSSELRSFVVRVPPACWDPKGISALKRVLSAKPKLRHLFLDFHGYECKTGKTLKCVLDYIQERQMCSDNLISVSGLGCFDKKNDKWDDALDGYYSQEGQKCLVEETSGLTTFEAMGCVIHW